jgi:thiamine-phosphate pyrophosphorylase|tara:strand:- start:606 stop:1223 length:618 start_codon:yes stop_codon:yes gene_type:complete
LRINKKKFIYLVSPNKISNNNFYEDLVNVFKSNKISFFQLRLKNTKMEKKILIGKKVKKICKKYNVKFLINDEPNLAKKLNTDGCHLGQKDMNINEARKILKNKIIGITCHNSIKLAKIAIDNNADYIAFGAFNDSKTKKARYKAKINILLSIKKMTNIPVVAIGGINSKNYKKLILNKANFLAISGYIWNNKKYKPSEAIEKIK